MLLLCLRVRLGLFHQDKKVGDASIYLGIYSMPNAAISTVQPTAHSPGGYKNREQSTRMSCSIDLHPFS